ncbi:hypothetical protein E2542_SST09563 [Spatholobus suberectus]|nr:hypothetical protein E2542_SST09563 [Spatholobus suberectus]
MQTYITYYMSSGGSEPPRPPSPRGNKGKGIVKEKKHYAIKTLSHRDKQPSFGPTLSTAPIPSPSPAATSTASPSLAAASTSTPSLFPATTPTPSSAAAPTPSPAVAPTPSPTIAPTPSLVVAPTPSSRINDMPLHAAEHMSAHQGNSHELVEDPPLGDLPMIRPSGGGLLNQDIHSGHLGMRLQFRSKVRWRLEHEDDIKKKFHSKASHRLSEMFMEARKDDKRPELIGEHVWNSLLAHWNAPSYRSKCAQAQKIKRPRKVGVYT